MAKLADAETGAQDGRALAIMLEALADHGGQALFATLADAVAQQHGQPLPPKEREELRRLLERDGVTQGYVLLPEQGRGEWTLAPRGRDYLQATATEAEETESTGEAPEESGAITQPFNPSLIKVDSDQMLLFQVLRKIANEEIVLRPEFQRNLVWNPGRQSRLIESILLRIPLPAFYLDAAREDKWQVVDGLQRLSTLDDFYNKKTLRLSGLEYLKELEGKSYDDLPRNLQRVIEDYTRLTLYIIKPETPRYVKFMIFSRVNTGGLTLTPQEIRHALYQGPATTLLKALAERPEFLSATNRSISPLRMDDRECVLRFIAFYQSPYEQFGSRVREGEPANLDSLLNQTMENLNKMAGSERQQIADVFCQSMIKAERVFGPYAFRKLYDLNGKRYPISKPLFEVWSVLLAQYPLEPLEAHREAIVASFIDVLRNDSDFVTAISLGTGSRTNVIRRFGRIARLLREVVG